MEPQAIEVQYHLLETSRICASANESNFHIFYAIFGSTIEILKECRLDGYTAFAVSLHFFYISTKIIDDTILTIFYIAFQQTSATLQF